MPFVVYIQSRRDGIIVAMYVALFCESHRDDIIIYIIMVNTILNNEFHQLCELSPADGFIFPRG